jgi:peptidoglycan/xylan/chitin deacetylase (PgdA/CDA1 family)
MFNDVVAHAVGRCSEVEIDLAELDLGQHSLASLAERRAALSRLLPMIKVLPLSRRSEVVERICQLAGVGMPHSLMMTSDQVASLKRQGFEIGAHTDMHPILARVEATDAHNEIQRSRCRLQEITGAPVRFFAYPNGRPGEDFTPQTVQIVREVGFDAACTTTPGVATVQTDLFQLPRFTPWDREPFKFGLRMIRNLINARSLTAETALTIGGQPAVTA